MSQVLSTNKSVSQVMGLSLCKLSLLIGAASLHTMTTPGAALMSIYSQWPDLNSTT